MARGERARRGQVLHVLAEQERIASLLATSQKQEHGKQPDPSHVGFLRAGMVVRSSQRNKSKRLLLAEQDGALLRPTICVAAWDRRREPRVRGTAGLASLA